MKYKRHDGFVLFVSYTKLLLYVILCADKLQKYLVLYILLEKIIISVKSIFTNSLFTIINIYTTQPLGYMEEE